MSDFGSSEKCVWVCQNRTCKKQGALAVFQAFEALQLPGWTIIKANAWGNAATVQWCEYSPVMFGIGECSQEEVSAIAKRHLLHGEPVQAMLYPRFTHG